MIAAVHVGTIDPSVDSEESRRLATSSDPQLTPPRRSGPPREERKQDHSPAAVRRRVRGPGSEAALRGLGTRRPLAATEAGQRQWEDSVPVRHRPQDTSARSSTTACRSWLSPRGSLVSVLPIVATPNRRPTRTEPPRDVTAGIDPFESLPRPTLPMRDLMEPRP